MGVTDFLRSFTTGEYEIKRCGQYKIFDKNELTGEPFNCAILMHSSSTGGWPKVAGIYFGNEIVVYNSLFSGYGRRRYSSPNTLSTSHNSYSANLTALHEQLDLTDSAPVDHAGAAAVVDIGGRDFLLDRTRACCGTRITKEEFIVGTRQLDGPTVKRAAVPLCRRVSSVKEARESLVPDEAKTTPKSFYYGGLWFVPNNEVKILNATSSEIAKIRYVYGRPPLPSLNGIPIGVLSDEGLLSDSVMKRVEHWGVDKDKLRWETNLKKIGEVDYIEKVKTWLEAKDTLYSTLNIDGRSDPSGARIAEANGVGSEKITLAAARAIGQKLYTTGKLRAGDHCTDLGDQVYEVLYPTARFNVAQ